MPQKGDTKKLNDENVVISGMSGLYPKARSVKELSDILYNKVRLNLILCTINISVFYRISKHSPETMPEIYCINSINLIESCNKVQVINILLKF